MSELLDGEDDSIGLLLLLSCGKEGDLEERFVDEDTTPLAILLERPEV